ncbi:MAG: glycoside hydrolase family 95 protein, partial [Planctomycetales bacterium]|nr:glycoside hydrolase family 95 protein [Planctomycetales bacterium]NIM07758.1 glycoside hydrolase family 95 protein [Planctomycetales bacterium]NIN07252.1 glycoside hydrolase family 95 protein [Planctomycetales bacterium]NIN76346.1 glycoside hydrolase family 95 protein [Planctomycetales bacterium]NIO33555.1 glycoside hydrolase family 95 protein [Planctomycetales bacterium]
MTRILLVILGLLASSSAVGGQRSATSLWFQQPATGFDQSLVLGNGRMGAMVWGGTDEERIVLNEESVWSGSRVENNVPGGYQYLPEMRRLLAEEKFVEANALKKKAFPTKGAPKYAKNISPFGRFQTLGNLRLKFTGNRDPVQDYRRQLDLATGLATVTYRRGPTSFTRQHFVSAPDQVFVSRFTGPVSFTVSLDRPERFETQAVGDRELLMTGHLNDGFDNDGLLVVGRVRVVARGGSVKAAGNTLAVTAADEVWLLLAAATDYRGIAGRQLSDPLAATTADLDQAEQKSFAQLRSAQQADHQRFFNRVTLSLPETNNSNLATDERLANYRKGAPDPALAALFANMGRYLLISSSRPGGLPANLQGIWA